MADGTAAGRRVDPITGAPTEAVSTVTIRYFAAARAAAGVVQEELVLGPAAEYSVGDVLDAAVDLHGPGLARVLARCSYLLDEVAVHGRPTPVTGGQVVDVLPPFAGG